MGRATRYRWDELDLEKITDMVACKAVATAHRTLSQTYFKKGTIVPRHSHAEDRMIYVLQGVLQLRIDGVEEVLREGDVMVVPADAVHEAESLDDTFVLTVA